MRKKKNGPASRREKQACRVETNYTLVIIYGSRATKDSRGNPYTNTRMNLLSANPTRRLLHEWLETTTPPDAKR